MATDALKAHEEACQKASHAEKRARNLLFAADEEYELIEHSMICNALPFSIETNGAGGHKSFHSHKGIGTLA